MALIKYAPACLGGCPWAPPTGETTLHLIFDHHPGGDRLPCPNPRRMPVSTALEQVKSTAALAADRGCRALRVCLLGGDPFADFERLRELCETAWQTAPLPLRFYLGTKWERLDEPSRAWCRERVQRLHLDLRCGYEEPLPPEALAFGAEVKAGLLYGLTVGAVEELERELRPAIEAGLEIGFVYPTGAWSEKLLQHYEEVLLRLTEESDVRWAFTRRMREQALRGRAGEPGPCVDTDGTRWPCPWLSPARLHAWQREPDAIAVALRQEQAYPPIIRLCTGQAIAFRGGSLRSQQKCERSAAIAELCRAAANGETEEQTVRAVLQWMEKQR